jgi:hypothetical protein
VGESGSPVEEIGANEAFTTPAVDMPRPGAEVRLEANPLREVHTARFEKQGEQYEGMLWNDLP